MTSVLASARDAYARARPFATTILVGAAALTIALAGARAIADIVGPVFLALVLTISLHPIRIWLERHRLPEWAASPVHRELHRGGRRQINSQDTQNFRVSRNEESGGLPPPTFSPLERVADCADGGADAFQATIATVLSQRHPQRRRDRRPPDAA